MMSKKRRWLLVAALVVLGCVVGLASCAYPRLSIRRARLDRVSLRGLTIELLMDVENPNQFRLPLEQVQWELNLFDTHVGGGASRLDKTLPAHQTTRVRMPITVRFRESISVVQKIARSRSIPWSIDGSATFRAPTGAISLDFDDGGRWNNPI